MAVLTAAAGDASQVARAATFRVEFVFDWQQAISRWGDHGAALLFQDPRWLAAWYRAFAVFDRVEPLIAIVTDAVTSEQVVLLPLVRRRHRGTRIVEFADLDVTDYNAPLLGVAAPRDEATARLLWRDLLAALKSLPGGADLVRFRKMPLDILGAPNPLALLEGAGRAPVNGNVVETGEDFDAYRRSLGRTVRKELERSWRVFTRHDGAAFRIVADRQEAMRLLSAMERQQGARMRDLKLNFMLNDEACAAFYRSLVDDIDSGYAVLSALTAGSEVVATLLGIRSGSRYVMVRISNAGDRWSNCSPGRLIIERTMAALHRDGVGVFDFSIGNYAYKRRFGVVPLPLAELTQALSWRGAPYALRDRAARALRRHPRLAAHIRRALGRPRSREDY